MDQPGLLGSRTVAFCVAGLAALTLVGAGSWLWGQRMGTARAIEEIRGRTEALGAQILGADVVTGLLTDDPLARERVDRLVDGHAAELLEVTLWTTDGDALYSRSRAATGAPEPLDATAMEALQTRTPSTGLRTSSDPTDTVLRVHQPVPRPEGDALLLRADYDYEVVTANGLRVWRAFAPVTLGALVVMAALWMMLAAIAGRRGRPARDVGDDAPVPEPPQSVRREPTPWLDEPEPSTKAFTTHVPTSPPRVREPAMNDAAGRSGPRSPATPADDDGGWLGTVQGDHLGRPCRSRSRCRRTRSCFRGHCATAARDPRRSRPSPG